MGENMSDIFVLYNMTLNVSFQVYSAVFIANKDGSKVLI